MRTLTKDDDVMFVALRVIAEANGPIGGLRLAEALQDAGIHVAEATAGRYLRALDRLGLTKLVATRGRVLTDEGRRRLSQLMATRHQDRQYAALVEAAQPNDIDTLIDLLYVRRAIEPTAARLAAVRASDDEIEAIQFAAQEHTHMASTGCDRVGPALNFHRLILDASHNALLKAIGSLIFRPTHDPLERLLDRVALGAGTTVISEGESLQAAIDFAYDHHIVVAALRARDPQAAESAMRMHLDKLIVRVEQYRQQHPNEDSGLFPLDT